MLNEALDVVMRASAFPELKRYVGDPIIVTDGTSLLGADNKSAIAEIMHAMETFQANPQMKHGDVKVVFVPDEEIGLLGAKALNVETSQSGTSPIRWIAARLARSSMRTGMRGDST